MDRGKGFAYFREFCLEHAELHDACDWSEIMRRFYALNHG